MSDLIEKLTSVKNNGSRRQGHIDLASECIKEVEHMKAQLKSLRDEVSRLKPRLVELLEAEYTSIDFDCCCIRRCDCVAMVERDQAEIREEINQLTEPKQ